MESLERRIVFGAGILYVDATQLPGVGTGTSWSEAFRDLPSAMAAATEGVEIRVAGGTYLAGSQRSHSIALRSNLRIDGGYAGRNAPDPDAKTGTTIVSGNIGNPSVGGDNLYHVITASGITGAVLSNLQIRGGNATGFGPDENNGGGLFIRNSTVTLNNVIIRNNTASIPDGNGGSIGSGGGLFADAGSTVTMNGGFFTENFAATGAGAAVLSTAFFTNVTFNENSGSTGGGLYLATGLNTPTLIERCNFYFNFGAFGGAIANYGSRTNISNSVFVGNSVSSNGGAIDNAFSSDLNIIYSTFSVNLASGVGGAVSNFQAGASIVNSIFWGDTDVTTASGTGCGAIYNWPNQTPASTLDIKFSLVQDFAASEATFTGTQLIDADPLFASTPVNSGQTRSNGDVRLRIGSPALDAGTVNTGTYTVSTDSFGSPRVGGAAPDLGAIEGAIDATPPTSLITFAPSFTNSGSFSVTWSGSDNVGVASYSLFVSENGGPFTPLLTDVAGTSTLFTNAVSGRTYGFYVLAKDSAGNVESKPAAAEVSTVVDTAVPVASMTALPAFVNSLSIPLSWSATDTGGSGVSTYTVLVSENGGNATPFLTATAATSGTFTGVAGRTYRFTTVALDRAGNASASSGPVVTRVDTTAPTSAVAALPVAVKSGNLTLQWSGSDNLSSVASYTIFVSENGGAFTPLMTPPTATSTTFNAVAGRTYSFYSVATDGAGNVEIQSAADTTVIVDDTPPVASTAELPTFTRNTTFPVAFSATDTGGSGVVSYSVFVSTDVSPNFTPVVTGTTATSVNFTGVAGRTYTFNTVATDAAGNISGNSNSVSTTLDVTPPTTSLDFLPQVSQATNVRVSWFGSDDLSGIQTYSVFVSDNGGPFTVFQSGVTGTSAVFTGTPGHTYGFYCIGTDVAGNVETKSVAEGTITISAGAQADVVAPVSALSPVPETSSVLTVPLQFTFSDTGGAGVSHVDLFFSVNGDPFRLFVRNFAPESGTGTRNFEGQPGVSYRFYSVAVDNAGNTEVKPAVAEATFTIAPSAVADTVAPTSAVSALPAITETASFQLNVTASDSNGSGVRTVQVFASTNGGSFQFIGSLAGSGVLNFNGVDGRTYAFRSVANDFAGNFEAVPDAPDASTTVAVDRALLTERGDALPASPNYRALRAKVTLPRQVNGAIVGGSVLKGSITLANVGAAATASVPLTFSLFLSSDGVLSSKDRSLVTLTRNAVRLRKDATLTLPFTVTLPRDFTGTTQLLAFVNPPTSAATLPARESTTLDNGLAIATFPVAIPALNLSAVSVAARPAKTGRNATANFSLLNPSNLPFSGRLTLTLSLIDAAGATVSSQTFSRSAVLPVGRSVRIPLTFRAPGAAGTYTVRAGFSLPSTFSQTLTTDDTATAPLTVAR